MKPPCGILVAGAVVMTAATDVKGASHDVEKAQSEEVVMKDDEKAHSYASVLKKVWDAATQRPVFARSNADAKDTSLDSLKASHMTPNSVYKTGSDKKDSGALNVAPKVVHEASPPDKTKFRPEFGPYANPKLHKDQVRVLQDDLYNCMGTGACNNSDPFCSIKNKSCNGDFSCSLSPGLHVEEGSCLGTRDCSESAGIAVGSGSCIKDSKTPTCSESKNSCIGKRSCLGESGTCYGSARIHVGSDACRGAFACARSPDARVSHGSCIEYAACYGSPNISIGSFSCRHNLACAYSGGAIIGRYACNCENCCKYLEEGCEIPDFACNSPSDNCSFPGSGSLGCPTIMTALMSLNINPGPN